MAKRTLIVVGLVLGAASILSAHDLFMKLGSYMVEPHSTVELTLMNGTFTSSESEVAADRVVDISLVSPTGRETLEASTLATSGNTTALEARTGGPGTYVAGLSLRKRVLKLEAASFNDYLEHEGIPDALEARRRDGELEEDVAERYSKHVKAIFQVGDDRTDGFSTVLGYPAELVPLQNPYEAHPGSELEFRALVDGSPVAHQVVLAGGRNADGAFDEVSTRTDEHGIARFTLAAAGDWYVKFISMVKVTDGGATYESTWTTLTFALPEK